MELKDGRITMLASDEGVTIELHDNEASITFVKVTLNPVQFCQAVSRLGYTKCDKMEVSALNKIGKKHENKTLKFEISEDLRLGYQKDNSKLNNLAKTACPEGWTPDLSFQLSMIILS